MTKRYKVPEDYRLPARVRKNLEYILEDLRREGRTVICPSVYQDVEVPYHFNCVMFFRKIPANKKEPWRCDVPCDCPCNVYSKKYLIRRVKEILKKY